VRSNRAGSLTARRLTLLAGIVGGVPLGAVVPLSAAGALGLHLLGGWGSVVLVALGLMALGVGVDRVTAPANRFGLGIALGVPVGLAGVVALLVGLALSIGS